MAKTILVAGYGPGISAAVAEKFGAEGFQVALVGRTAQKLEAGVKSLEAKGVKAAGFAADLADPAAVREVIAKVRARFGPLSVIEWTAFIPGNLAGDLLKASAEELRSLFEVSIIGLVAAVQAALPDLKSEKGALLVTNGGAGFVDPNVDATLVQYGLMGLGVSNAAKHKLVGLLAKKLEADGIYVGEIMVSGSIKGTAFDRGDGSAIDPKTVAAKYWEIYTARKDVRTTVK
ncbi:MAG TPA: SDR family NAD(P)-dependent oxidoreductase [Polyangia bacterium]|nr:SDR family NAD(P)-dependent oxidoreductase [Polyangia bacterium]